MSAEANSVFGVWIGLGIYIISISIGRLDFKPDITSKERANNVGIVVYSFSGFHRLYDFGVVPVFYADEIFI